MEVLIELLIEIFGELFIEIIASAIGSFLESIFYNYTFSEEHKKRTIRYIVYGSYSLALVVLLIFCILYSKTVFTLVTAVFIFVNTGLALLAKTFGRKKYIGWAIFLRALQFILHSSYSIFIFVKASTFENINGRVTLIVLTSIGLICALIIDIYRINNLRNTRIKEMEIRS